MTARIVFSNGSKQMAHNLDDLYERWTVRREELAAENPYVNPEAEIELFVPELPAFDTLQQVREYRQVLVDKYQYALNALAKLKLEYQSTEMVKAVFDARRAPLGVAITRLNMQMSQVKLFIEGEDRAQRKANLQAIKKQAPAQFDQVAATRRVQELKPKEENGTLTTAELRDIQLCRQMLGERAIDGQFASLPDERTEARIVGLEELVSNLRKDLTRTQGKLIDAYERIIQLQEADEC